MYEVDLPLFDGALLADYPLAECELNVISGLYGLHDVSTLVDYPDKSSKWLQEIGQDVNLAAGQADQNGLLSPFGESWLDSKMDLLEFMGLPVTAGDNSGINSSIIMEDKSSSPLLEPSAQAVQLLEEAAEQAADMLSTTKSQPYIADNTLCDGMDLLDMLYNVADPSCDVMDNSVLSPMSPEDIESLLSSAPTSPYTEDSFLTSLTGSDFSVSDLSISGDDTMIAISVPDDTSVQSDLEQLLLAVEANKGLEQVDYQPDTKSPIPSLSRAKPYERKQTKDRKAKAPPLTKEEKILDRKLRKKQQNKDAATRYRQKKREENDAVGSELDQLDTRNTELKDTVSKMTGEIQYLKNLLAEVYQARGLKLKSSK